MDMGLHDKLAFVSGSTAGIGLAVARTLLDEGARVIVNGRHANELDVVLASLTAVGYVKAVGFAGDVCNADIAASLIQKYPDIDILVNNVGTYEIKSYLEITDADWMRLFNINVLSGARLARLVLPSMQRRNWGRIVFISSESGINIPPEMIHYGMTKAAQLAISRGLAEAVAGSGITVNSVLPGPTWSRGVSRLLKEGAEISTPDAELEAYFFQSIRPSSIIQRFIYPAEVASLVAYVTSMQASAITGAALRVEGGVIRGAY